MNFQPNLFISFHQIFNKLNLFSEIVDESFVNYNGNEIYIKEEELYPNGGPSNSNNFNTAYLDFLGQVPEPHHQSSPLTSESETSQKALVCEDEEKKFACQICNARFKTAGLWSQHQKKHSNYRPFKCTQCTLGFKTKFALNRHMQTIHRVEKSVSDDKRNTFSCNLCGKLLKSELTLRVHQITHSENRPFRCRVCFLTFKSMRDLQTHEDKYHVETRLYQCSKCSKIVQSLEDVKGHIQCASSFLVIFTCNYCFNVFRKKEDLESHKLKNHHPYQDELKAQQIQQIIKEPSLPPNTIIVSGEQTVNVAKRKRMSKVNASNYRSVKCKNCKQNMVLNDLYEGESTGQFLFKCSPCNINLSFSDAKAMLAYINMRL